jgi:hypothetical protein
MHQEASDEGTHLILREGAREEVPTPDAMVHRARKAPPERAFDKLAVDPERWTHWQPIPTSSCRPLRLKRKPRRKGARQGRFSNILSILIECVGAKPRVPARSYALLVVPMCCDACCAGWACARAPSIRLAIVALARALPLMARDAAARWHNPLTHLRSFVRRSGAGSGLRYR